MESLMSCFNMNKIVYYISVLSGILVFTNSCDVSVSNNTNVQNTSDTLVVDYFLDTLLIGEQIFPFEEDSSRLAEILEDTLMLVFKLNNSSYYCFYNPTANLEFLSNSFRNTKATLAIEDFYLREKRIFDLYKNDYHSPYLTGFYDTNDSIIVDTRDLNFYIENKVSKPIYCSYFSISDTLINFSPYFNINAELQNVLNNIFLPPTLNIEREDFQLVLLNSISSIQNVWYNKLKSIEFPEMSNFIILTFEEKKIIRIQFSDLEYLPLVFKQMTIYTNDIIQQ